MVLYVLGIAGLVGLGLLMIVESFGIPPLPSEVILPIRPAFHVATGHYSFLAAFLVALAGALVGTGSLRMRWVAGVAGGSNRKVEADSGSTPSC